MDSLEYQKNLAEYDEQISYHKSKQSQLEHEKSRFILSVLSATVDDHKKSQKGTVEFGAK